eukprot:UN24253
MIRELRHGRILPQELKMIGFSARQLHAGYTWCEIRNGGYSIKEIYRAGCPLDELKTVAFFTAREWHDEGYSALLTTRAGYTPRELCKGKFKVEELYKKLGYSQRDLRVAGYTAQDWLEKYDLYVFGWRYRLQGIFADRIGNTKQTIADVILLYDWRHRLIQEIISLKEAGGYGAADLRSCGCRLTDLSMCGFQDTELRMGGYGPNDFRKFDNRSLENLKNNW